MPSSLPSPLFAFLSELKANNTREWFAANRDRFVSDVETPMREFITAFEPHLQRISSQFAASPRARGGSFTGLEHRTRFPVDAAPYRTAAVARFAHRARRVKWPPMFYLHIEPGRSFGGGGMYHPDPASLSRIRAAIDGQRDEWQAVVAAAPIVHAETLTRTPAGYPSDHPFAADLKRKGHVVMTSFSDADVAAPEFLEQFVDACLAATPLVRFLTKAVALPW